MSKHWKPCLKKTKTKITTGKKCLPSTTIITYSTKMREVYCSHFVFPDDPQNVPL